MVFSKAEGTGRTGRLPELCLPGRPGLATVPSASHRVSKLPRPANWAVSCPSTPESAVEQTLQPLPQVRASQAASFPS